MVYQVVIEKDGDAVDNQGAVIASYDTEEHARAFVDGVEYVNDSSLIVAVKEVSV